MNGYERIKAALEGRTPDRTPVMLHNFMMAAREAGYTMAEYREDPHKIAASFIQAVERYDYDGILVEIDTVTLSGAVGVPVDFPDDLPARSCEGCIASLDELDRLQPVDITQYKYVNIWLEAVKLLKDHFKNEIHVRGNCDQAPFSLASTMRKLQQWMMDLVMHEEQALELIEYCADACCRFIRLMAQAGADSISNGDSPAGPELISPAMYAKFALPYEKILVETAHQCGLPYTLHICGDTGLILDSLPATGTDAVELDYKTDAQKAHDLFKESITFIGNIDPSGVLALGTADDVKRQADRLLEIFADTPRFILNAGCAIPANAPSANIKALVQSVR